jgi:hypothetical protein
MPGLRRAQSSATIIWSLRDKHPCLLMLMRTRGPAIARHLPDPLISVSSVSLADVAKGGDGATCPP